MSLSHTTLLVPGLFQTDHIERGMPIDRLFEGLDLGLFWRLLSRADTVFDSTRPATPEHLILSLFGWHIGDGDELPIGALYATDSPRPVWAIKADPVYLQPGLNDVTVMHPRELAITEQESVRLVDDINKHFNSPDWQLVMITAESWLVVGTRSFALTTTPLSQSKHCEPKSQLPGGEDGAYWRQVLTEMQMLLHEHPVNQARKSSRQPINSVWLWGSATPSQTPDNPWDAVFSDEPLTVAACHYSGSPARAPAQNVGELALNTRQYVSSLVVLDELLAATRAGDLLDWREATENLANQWLVPFLSDLQRHQRVVIDFGLNRRFRYSSGMARRWWRKTKSAAQLCGISE